MMLTIRLTQIAFNYRDGNVDSSKNRPEFESYKIKHLPSLLEVFLLYLFIAFIITV